jgi:hypothetical protein
MANQEKGGNPLPGELMTIAPWYPRALRILKWSAIIVLILTIGLIFRISALGPWWLLVVAGVALILQAVRYYLKVIYQYSLQDRQDTKDQAVGSDVSVTRSDQREGDLSEQIAARHHHKKQPDPLIDAVAGAFCVTYLPPKSGLKGDRRAREVEVQRGPLAAGSPS